jgi:beta-lactamase superfamily II metal-dependent hydrolase
MMLEVFNVEHGACSLLTCDDGTLIAIDCGHNTTTRWTLHAHLLARGITHLHQLWITNLDQDHLSGLVPLWQSVTIRDIRINPSLTANDLWRLKYLGGTPSNDIALLCRLMQEGFVNREPWIVPDGIEAVAAWNCLGRPFWDTNNLSMALVLTLRGIRILFPGDLERAGMEKLLLLPPEPFGNAVRRIDLLMAPHHGRLNGICQRLFDAQAFGKPMACIKSDGPIQHESQATDGWYRDRVSGIVLTDNTPRYVLTTRRDGNITIEVQASRPAWFTVRVGQPKALQLARPTSAYGGLDNVFAGGGLLGVR